MRILCAHGIGQNSIVFEAFTQSIRHFLPNHYDFVFFDGQDESEPAPGIGDLFPPPYYCHYTKFYPSYVQRSHEHVLQIIEEEGPFDGVLAFSQGAACISSLMLHHEHDNPHLPPLFRFAIFMNGSAPICATDDVGWDVTPGYAHVSLNHYLGKNALTRPRRKSDIEAETETDSEKSKSNSPRDSQANLDRVTTDENGLLQQVRWWVPEVDAERISIPTLHIHGAKDGWLKEANDLMNMCDPKMAVVFKHNEGHEIPKRLDLAKKIAELIETVAIRSETMMF